MKEADSLRTFPSSLIFPIDRLLVEGVLFAPRQMEQKWAIFSVISLMQAL
jgi:hypothetical protein